MADPKDGTDATWARVDEILERMADEDTADRTTRIERVRRADPGLADEVASLAEHIEPATAFFGRLSAALAGRASTERQGGGDDATPSRIGPYELGERIGGGMCLVYDARDTRTGARVALKIARMGSDEITRERMMRESRADVELDHPNICRLLDFDVDPQGRPYLVLEFVEGDTLKSILKAGPLSARQAIRLGARIADALAHAHGRGIIHRDVKPGNVMIRGDGSPVLLDFGIAKLGESAFTNTGIVVGTPAWMSPEQLEGAPITAATDVWSLGLVLWQCLTGEHPFRGPSLRYTLRNLMTGAVPPFPETAVDVPDAVRRTVEAALSRDPEGRPAAAAVAERLASA